MRPFWWGLVLGLGLAACADPDAGSPKVRVTVEAAPPLISEPEAETPIKPLSPDVETKIADIRGVLERNSLTRFVRLAEAEPTFVSNFAGEGHRVHWDLLRRTGFDPLLKIGELLDGPYGTREVGSQTWYIWPDLAALSAEDLIPERLSFADRARLEGLVGEVGLERIRSGQGYPGVRTAIAEDGRWLYFVHETEDDPVDQASEDQ